MATEHQKFTVNVPKNFKPRTRLALAKDIIKHVIERSKQGNDIDGKKFVKYEKIYAKFKGVSRSAVDLTLEDKMLKAMKLLSNESGKIVIGYENGSLQNAKADGNHRGTYGRPSPIPGKARPFVGISAKDREVLVNKHKEIQRIAQEVVAGIR